VYILYPLTYPKFNEKFSQEVQHIRSWNKQIVVYSINNLIKDTTSTVQNIVVIKNALF
jgi:hypothetical protein